MVIIHSVPDLDEDTRLRTFHQIVDGLVRDRESGEPTDPATFAPPLHRERGQVLARRRA